MGLNNAVTNGAARNDNNATGQYNSVMTTTIAPLPNSLAPTPTPTPSGKRRYMSVDAPATARRLRDLAQILDNQIAHYSRMAAAHALDKDGIQALKSLAQIADLLEIQESKELNKLNAALDSMTEAQLLEAESQVLEIAQAPLLTSVKKKK